MTYKRTHSKYDETLLTYRGYWVRRNKHGLMYVEKPGFLIMGWVGNIPDAKKMITGFFKKRNPNRRNQKLGVIVTRPKPKRKSNPHMVKIYDKITRIEGQKGSDSKFPGERFYHNFSKPYPAMYGTPDRKTLIIKKG